MALHHHGSDGSCRPGLGGLFGCPACDEPEVRPIEIRRRDPAEVRALLLAPDSPLPRDLAEALAAGLPASHADGEPDVSQVPSGEPRQSEPGVPSDGEPEGAPPGELTGAPPGEPPSGAPQGAPARKVRRGTRTFIREHFECRPGGCGAKAGESCVAYRATRWSDSPSGRPSTNVHAPRWRAFHAWLAEQAAAGTR